MRVRYLLNGQDCNPVKREGIYIEVNHDQGAIIDEPQPHVGVKNLYLAREDILKINAALNNPPGITEGASFDIVITEGLLVETINMYIDMMVGYIGSKDGIQVSIKMLHSLDWVDDSFNGFTLESMYNETGVASFQIDNITYTSYQDFFDKRCIFVPYVLSTIPNFRDAFMALLSLNYIMGQIKTAVKSFIQWCTPIAGVLPSVGIAQVVVEVIFFLLMLAALISLLIHLFDCLIQHIKYHGAMLVIDMLKIISHKRGLAFQSSIWQNYPYNSIAYLPEKYNPLEEQNPAANTIFGVTFGGFAKRGFHSPGYATSAVHDSSTSTVQKGYYNGVAGDFLRLVKKFCNGKIIIPDQTNTFLLERRDFYPSNTPFQMPDIRQDWNGYNTDELSASIEVRFADDLNDKNSIDQYIGTILEAVHQQIITNDPRKVNLKGLRVIAIEAARGIRKTKLNFIEQIHKDLYVAFHKIANAGIAVLNVAIIVMDALIIIIDALVLVFNVLMDVLIAVVKLVDDIINAISSLFGGNGLVVPPSWVPLKQNMISPVSTIHFLHGHSSSYIDRIDALLLENDMVATPKFLLVDMNRPEFTASGGYSGQQRIAYLKPVDNENVINAQWLWNNFYFIDAFVGALNNRFTKIAPATNHDSDKNPILLRCADFKNLVSNPKFKDNFAEDVIAETIQWHIERNGSADLQFRKAGWLRDPQNKNGSIRAQEININLQVKTSLPNGQ